MSSLVAHALYKGLVRALQQRRVSLLPLWALALLAYSLGKLLARWKPQQRSRAPVLEPTGAGSAAAAAAANPAAEPSALLLPGGAAPAPVCAVVVPARVLTEQQGAGLQRLITRLSLEQNRHPSYLILVDDCSPMPISSLIPAACRQLTEAHPSLVVERLPAPRGPAAARNAGLMMAASMGAELVLLTEASCLPERDWVGGMLAAHMRSPGIVVGRTRAARPGTTFSRFQEAFAPSSLLLSAGNLAVALPHGPLRPTASAAGGHAGVEAGRHVHTIAQHGFPHDRLLLFDETLAAESFAGVDYLVSAAKAGMALSHAPQACVSCVAGSGGPAALFQRFAAYGREEGALLAKHPLYEAWLEQAGLMPEDIGWPTAAAPAGPAQ